MMGDMVDVELWELRFVEFDIEDMTSADSKSAN
jgi:hypothetical protein